MRNDPYSHRVSDEAGLTSIWTVPGYTPMADLSDVQPFDDQLGATVTAISTVVPNCAGLTPADATEWSGIAAAYAALHAKLEAVMGTGDVTYQRAVFAEILGQEEALSAQVAVWQQKIAVLCPKQTSNLPSLPAAPAPSGTAGGAFGGLLGLGAFGWWAAAAAAAVVVVLERKRVFGWLGGRR
jgi:hypothetical protein